MKTLVIGLGNPILTDDGVGVKVAYAVENALPADLRPYVEVTEASVGGLRLMEMMVGYDCVIIIDAILDESAPPGTIHRMTLPDLAAISPLQHTASAHDVSLIIALETGRRMGLSLPDRIIIYAITVNNVLDFGDQLTPAVAKAVSWAAQAVLDELVRT
ncbi:MAG: hydrogenase maturation protease [Chloroflexi bacterium]|nr:hydrogenase maturation protease [Chloroflexota bacterium]